jgi:hypothetical protein
MTRMTRWAVTGCFCRPKLPCIETGSYVDPLSKISSALTGLSLSSCFLLPAAAEENIFVNRIRRFLTEELPIE